MMNTIIPTTLAIAVAQVLSKSKIRGTTLGGANQALALNRC
ncbi:MAG: hypothetical protein AB1489_16145 [Acidobacteriota bacterium]